MRMFDLLVLGLVIAQALDFGTTLYVLRRGGRELSPIVRKAMDILGLVPGLLLVKVIAGAATIYAAAWMPVLGVISLAAYGLIIAWNTVWVWRASQETPE